jgi:hypothetical protein
MRPRPCTQAPSNSPSPLGRAGVRGGATKSSTRPQMDSGCPCAPAKIPFSEYEYCTLQPAAVLILHMAHFMLSNTRRFVAPLRGHPAISRCPPPLLMGHMVSTSALCLSRTRVAAPLRSPSPLRLANPTARSRSRLAGRRTQTPPPFGPIRSYWELFGVHFFISSPGLPFRPLSAPNLTTSTHPVSPTPTEPLHSKNWAPRPPLRRPVRKGTVSYGKLRKHFFLFRHPPMTLPFPNVHL